MRFTSGHGVAGMMSGVEAAIHGGDELWFGVGIEVSEWDQNFAKIQGEMDQELIWNRAVEFRPHLYRICSKLQ